MARALLVVQRHANAACRLGPYVDMLNRNLAPDNIAPRAPTVACADGATVAIFNPSDATRMSGTSACVGVLVGEQQRWHECGAPVPDGTFALLRADAQRAELIADAAGSRTIWYVLTDDELIASTSQRALVALLGTFELNREVLPWMLSSGTLGPTGGWDTRFRQVRPGERVTLDRARWRLFHEVASDAFEPDDRGGDRLGELARTVDDACRAWSFDPDKWLLTLSGGADSRCLLVMLHQRKGLKSATWGTTSSRSEEGNDAQVARAIADLFGVENRFFPTDLSMVPPDTVIRRFVAAGEGRVARISGYLDGFAIWKTLFDEGVHGVIRGDEAFGSIIVRNPYTVRHTSSLTMLPDYFAPAEVAEFELPAQSVPPNLERRSNETLATWRDRLYQQFRVPILLAGLTDLKVGYVEIANPLLTRAVLDCVRRLPDDLRTEKRLWKQLVRAQLPDVPFANRIAIESLEDFVAHPAVLQLMIDELDSENARSLFAPMLLAKMGTALRAALSAAPAPKRRREFRLPLAYAVPDRLRAAARSWLTSPPGLSSLVLAFRSFLASRMNALLKLDAATPPADLQRVANL
jgi:hypothetical protein